MRKHQFNSVSEAFAFFFAMNDFTDEMAEGKTKQQREFAKAHDIPVTEIASTVNKLAQLMYCPKCGREISPHRRCIC